DALDAAALTLEATPTADSLAATQTAWRAARAALRKLDALHFGPIATLGIGDRIDASPADDTSIDGIVAATTPIDSTFIGSLGDTSKGFLGVEYLLFSADGADAALARLVGDGAPARRRTLLRAMCDEVAASAHALSDAWSDPTTGYALAITTAGAGSKVYPRQRGALDDLVGGSAYALEVVVGIRLAIPLGKKSTTGMPDPSADPTLASDSAVNDMNATLAGTLAMWSGQGFNAQVLSSSAQMDSQAVTEQTACDTSVAAIPSPFAAAVVNQTATVTAAYDACKTWKDSWNMELTSALGASLQVSDNDGD
ncbi:MAG TPA: imelysin family protein, partial [Polyangia bacterium]|nr:imelysin family protein [Polyangia bacterium]